MIAADERHHFAAGEPLDHSPGARNAHGTGVAVAIFLLDTSVETAHVSVDVDGARDGGPE